MSEQKKLTGGADIRFDSNVTTAIGLLTELRQIGLHATSLTASAGQIN